MHGRKFLRILQVLVILYALGANISPPLSSTQTIWHNSKSAQAANTTPSTVYLPLINKFYPLMTVFGVEMHRMTASGGLDEVVQAGTTWVRRNALFWSDVEPTEGTYQWSAVASLEQELINASNNGIEVILVVRRTPEWAQLYDGVFCGPMRSEKFSAFANFMHEAVSRYSKPPYNVKYWQIWNEPDVDRNFVPSPDMMFGCWAEYSDPYYGGGYYGDMLSVVYPIIKQANPQAQVIIGGLLLACNEEYTDSCSFHGMKYLEGILRREPDDDGKYPDDGGNYFDGVAFHAYEDYWGELGQYGNAGWHSEWFEEGPIIIKKSSFIRSVLSQYSVSGKFLMSTEIALRNCWGSESDPVFMETKAYYVPQVYAASIAEGLIATIWYSVNETWCESGLMNRDYSSTPAYETYKFARNTLRDAKYISDITEFSGLKGYKFIRDDRVLWILWANSETQKSIQLPATPSATWDVFGDALSITGTSITIGLKPIYLEWAP